MDSCLVDIATEFLAVAFHNILYYASVYPRSVFETRKKYNVVVYRCTHPEINQYIELCLKSVAECLKTGQLSRIEFCITDVAYKPVMKVVFDLHRNDHFDDISDAYFVQCEQNLRAFCLNLSSISHKLTDLPEDCSFSINLHTDESTAVALACNPDLENFPLVEVGERYKGDEKILPLRTFSIKKLNLDTYIEIL